MYKQEEKRLLAPAWTLDSRSVTKESSAFCTLKNLTGLKLDILIGKSQVGKDEDFEHTNLNVPKKESKNLHSLVLVTMVIIKIKFSGVLVLEEKRDKMNQEFSHNFISAWNNSYYEKNYDYIIKSVY